MPRDGKTPSTAYSVRDFVTELDRDSRRHEPPETRKKALRHVDSFKKWALANLFAVTEDGASSTVILVPHGRPGANYRDREPEKSGFSAPYPLPNPSG